MEPTVSVVIPFYNHVDWLEEALLSVFNQTYKKIEVIVIDDGSEERTDDICKRFGEKIIYVKQSNSGPAVARNRGIELATGKYIAFLDSDDLWVENKLEIQVTRMEDQNALWSCMNYETFGEECKVVSVNGRVTNHFPQILCSANIATPTIMIRTDVLKEDSRLRFPTHMRKGQDYFLWLQLSMVEDILNINETGARVRIRSDSTMHMVVHQLSVRAVIADWIVLASQNNKVGLLTKLGYRLSKWGFSVYCAKTPKNIKRREILAMLLYVLPYMIFKIGVIVYSKESRCEKCPRL